MPNTYEWKKIKDILNGDGSEIQKQLIFAGLLLMIFEQFKKYLINTIEAFFSNNFEFKEGTIVYKRGEEFKKIIKEYGKGEEGQHKNDSFRAALRWLHDFHAISKEELDNIERLYLIRNNIGHELFSIIVDDNKHFIKIEDINILLNIYLKTVRWWLKEVEATTNPYFIEKEYEPFDFDAAESFETLILKAVLDKVLFSTTNKL